MHVAFGLCVCVCVCVCAFIDCLFHYSMKYETFERCIPHEKIVDLYFFMPRLRYFSELSPFENKI